MGKPRGAAWSRGTRPETGDMVIRADIAIVGAGIGGLALAGLLSRRGGKVRVYVERLE